MGAKWFCNKCGKEIWKGLSNDIKKTTTVYEMELSCVCTDCAIAESKKE